MTIPPSENASRAERPLPRLTLRNKLYLFAFALVVLPGALLGWLATRNASAALEAAIGRQLAREAGHTADRLAAQLRAERRTLASFARQDLMRDVRVGDVDKRVSQALATLRAGGQRDFYVVDAQSHVVAASEPSAIGERPSWLSPDWLSGDPERAIGPLGGPYFAAPRLVLATSIADPDDELGTLGTLLGVYDWEALLAATRAVQRDLEAQGLAPSVIVCGADGALLGGAWAAGGNRDALAQCAHQVAAQGSDGARWSAAHATDPIVGRAQLAEGPSPWRVLVLEPRESALAPVRSLQLRMAITLGFILAVALMAAAVASRRVVRPLTEMTEATRRLARREPGAPLAVPVRSDDELGVLAGSFNRMSADLERAQRELVEAEKFAFVGELAAGVAHEIRTSLGVLRSSAQLLDRALSPDATDDARELAQMIRDGVGRLGGVVDDLLTLKPTRTLRLEAGPLTPLLERAVEFASPAARAKGVQLRCAAARAEPDVAREPELIVQVAVNLIVNAVQALPAGGNVEARVLDARDGYGGFEVCDDGPGIPDELRERVFQPFVSARSGGVGLGLTFVKRVVHEHRGRVAIDSAPGGGARVRVELPLAEPTP